ncbi:methyltransferase [Myxococcaceae bacterium GXIMD 01537]
MRASTSMLADWPRRVRLDLRPGPGETLDSICGGRVRLLQRRAGYRFSLDPILLAHFAEGEGRARRGPVIDLGTGTGIIPLILSRRLGRRDVTGLELQPRLYALAERNIHLNRVEHEVTLVRGDLRRVDRLFSPASFAQVLCNPPYRPRAAGAASAQPERALARHELACELADVARAAAYLLAPRGGLYLVYPAARLAELAEVLRGERLEPRTVRLVHPRADRPAKLVLLHAVKGGRSCLTVRPPLVLHAADAQAFTDEVIAMLG